MDWTRRNVCERAVDRLERRFSISRLTASLLLQRGVDTEEDAQRFLSPCLSQLADPFLIKDMRLATARIHEALVREERIHVHGDYDVDGITATSLLVDGLRFLGAHVHPHIAVRGEDEVGLSVAGLERDHLPLRPDLLLTVDCGTTNIDAIAKATEAGVDVIVVDHHQPSHALPQCTALLNPMHPENRYPFTALAAVGVAFQLLRALDAYLAWKEPGRWPRVPLVLYTDLVALGTIADVVPLVEENRVLTRVGLDELARARRPGVCALLRTSNLLREDTPRDVLRSLVTPRLIGYRIAPLLNAAGRMGDANPCVELLTTTSYRTAAEIAKQLEHTNGQRQVSERKVQAEALVMAEVAVERGDPLLLLCDEAWHPGVLGIVASRLAERFQRPAIVTAVDAAGLARGSVRSPDTVDMLALLGQCADLLTTFGGHRVAAGVSFPHRNLDTLRSRLIEAFHARPEGDDLGRELLVDAEVGASDLSEDLFRELEQLGPFGTGNDEPVFVLRDVQPLQLKSVSGDHLKLRIRQGTLTIDAFGFGMAQRRRELRQRVDIAFTPRTTTADASGRIEVILRDIRPSEA